MSNFSKNSTIVQIVNNFQKKLKLSKFIIISKIVKMVKNCQKCQNCQDITLTSNKGLLGHFVVL